MLSLLLRITIEKSRYEMVKDAGTQRKHFKVTFKKKPLINLINGGSFGIFFSYSVVSIDLTFCSLSDLASETECWNYIPLKFELKVSLSKAMKRYVPPPN